MPSDPSGLRLLVTPFAILLLAAVVLPVKAAGGMDGASAARGGRLYDNWYLETREAPPVAVHPRYRHESPDVYTAETSWRCVACHGWDYLGLDAQGTGPLVREGGLDADALGRVLNDANHAYGERLTPPDVADLAAFISVGTVAMDRYIEPGGNRLRGRADRESTLYATVCTNCHGVDGHKVAVSFPLGAFVRNNPRESLHKVLNGHPAERMPPLRFLGVERIVDLLAYVATLPAKDPYASIARGGRLYDNWIVELGVAAPAVRHPAYPRDAAYADAPALNWRCKECHGWDYRGRAGVYGSGGHRTGIKGIEGFQGRDPAEVITLLMDENHSYHGSRWHEGPMAIQDLQDLANFVVRGQIDMSRYIDPASRKAMAEPSRRRSEFDQLCATCHGRDGKALSTGRDIGRVARENPWEALHKIRNGHPDEAMPALLSLDMDFLVELLAYAQSLPE